MNAQLKRLLDGLEPPFTPPVRFVKPNVILDAHGAEVLRVKHPEREVLEFLVEALNVYSSDLAGRRAFLARVFA